ncbi:MAG: hypothetical protein RL591_50 [Planctomycetota bacterium]
MPIRHGHSKRRSVECSLRTSFVGDSPQSHPSTALRGPFISSEVVNCDVSSFEVGMLCAGRSARRPFDFQVRSFVADASVKLEPFEFESRNRRGCLSIRCMQAGFATPHQILKHRNSSLRNSSLRNSSSNALQHPARLGSFASSAGSRQQKDREPRLR